MPSNKKYTPISESKEAYLQDKGKGRSSESGNYRRNSERELDRFFEWAAGDRGGKDWDGITPDSREIPMFADLDEQVFREYARYLSGKGFKQNTTQTYYAYISAWCRWCVNEGYIDAQYSQRASATDKLPDDDGRRPGDQQAWSSDDRHAITKFVDEQAREAIEDYTTYRDRTPEEDFSDEKRLLKRYKALKATRDRALITLFAYSAIRAGELLRDPNDSRRRGVRWEDLDLEEEGRLDVYRKSQSWDSVGLSEHIIPAIERYHTVMDPPSERWPIFPAFDANTLLSVINDEFEDRGLRDEEIAERREQFPRDILLCLEEDIRPPSMSTDGGRHVLKKVTQKAGIDVDSPKSEYLTPHGGRRGMGEVLVRAFGFTAAARYLDNSEEMVRKRYSHLEAGELGDIATEAIEQVD